MTNRSNRIGWLFSRYFLWFGLAAWLAANALTLVRYPIINCDEGFYGLAGNYVVSALFGNAQPTLIPNYDTTLIPYGRINLLGIGFYLQLFGQNAFSARLWGLSGWLLSIVCTYWASKKLGLGKAALWPSLLLSVAWLSVLYGHNARPHIWVGAVGVISLGLLARALNKPEPGRLILASACPTLMLDLHLNSAHFLIASLLIGSWLLAQRGEIRKLVWLAIGVIMVVPFLIGARFIPDPAAAFNLIRSGHILSPVETYAVAQPGNLTAQFLADLPAHFLGLFDWWIEAYVHPPTYEGLLQAVFFITGLGLCLSSRDFFHRLLAVYYIIATFSFAALVTFKWNTYAVLWMPLLMLMTVAGVQRLQDFLPANFDYERLGTVILGLFLATYVAGDIFLMRQDRNADFFSASTQLQNTVPQNAIVLSEATWWLAIPSPNYIDEHLVIVGLQPEPRYQASSLSAEDFIAKEVFDALKPQYVLTDDLMGCEDTPSTAGLALTAITARRCTLVNTYPVIRPDGSTRPTDLYRCESN